jgi:Zn-finger nucleic acid-binding protein
MEYYTYAYLREDGTPYYIGKGKGNRIFSTNKRIIRTPKNKNMIIFLKKNLTEEEAFKHEIYMISIFGRKDLGTGILRNKTNGGDGISGYNHTEETKILISNLHKGKKLTEEHKKKVGDSLRGKKKKPLSDETKKKLSLSLKGRKCWNKGKPFSDEVKRKMSESGKGKQTPWLVGVSKCWITNGEIEKFIPIDEDIPIGYTMGRTKKNRRKKNKEEQKEYMKEYYQKNKEKYKEYSRRKKLKDVV